MRHQSVLSTIRCIRDDYYEVPCLYPSHPRSSWDPIYPVPSSTTIVASSQPDLSSYVWHLSLDPLFESAHTTHGRHIVS